MGLFSEDGVRIPFIGTFSSQPDFLIIPILIYARADIKLSGRELTTKLSEFKGTLINLRDTPDLLPVLAFIALFAKSISIFNGLEHLKYKESNRVENLIVNFKRLGASVSYEDGKLAVLPLIKAPESVVLDTQNDHRYAMIYYMISLLFPQVSVSETESIAKSYPNFIRDIEKLIK
jgi:3-phosphoshikimate 1-carboxyvinyltransferase